MSYLLQRIVMRSKYFLIKADPGREDDVLYELYKKSELRNIDFLFGEYDLLAQMETENEHDLSNVKKIPGIRVVKSFIMDEK